MSRPPLPPFNAEAAALQGIPVSRIHLHPQPGTATVRDLERLDGKTLGTCELIDGVIVEKQMGWYESLVASVLIELLAPHVRAQRLGIVLGSDGVLRLFGCAGGSTESR